MTFRRLFVWGLAVVFGVANAAWAQPLPKPEPAAALAKSERGDKLIAEDVANLIENVHYKKHKFDADISRRMHRLFIESFDSRKLFFLESDIAEFAESESKHAEQIAAGDFSFPVLVYERFLKRLTERNEWVQTLVDEKFDFTKDETIVIDPKAATYCKTTEEAKERWRAWIKYDLCSLIVDDIKEDEARNRVRKRYRNMVRFTKELDKNDLLERYLTAMATSFDPHSTYMSSKTLEEFEIAFRLQLQGIGALLRSDDGQTFIAEITPGGAADEDKRLKVGDRITGVGQGETGEIVDIDEMKLTSAVQLIRGAAGTKVRLEIIPNESKHRVVYTLTRKKIELTEKAAKGEIVEAPGATADGPKTKIGVISLPSFYADTSSDRDANSRRATNDIRKILLDFRQKGVNAVVMDLRNDGGGLLTEAISVTGLFIDEGPVVQVKDFNGKIKQHLDDIPGVVYDGPLVVLENKFSASASEIFCAAIQDYKRGIVVGDTSTHGKGSVQQIIDLSRVHGGSDKMGAVKITLQMFYRVNGDSTQNRGVSADVSLPSVTDGDRFSESKLDFALEGDTIAATTFKTANDVTKDLIQKVKSASIERRSKNEDFAKLEKRVSRVRELSEQKNITFNLEKLKKRKADLKQLAEFDENDDDDTAKLNPMKKVEKKFGATTYDKEVLAIAADVARFEKATPKP